MFLISCFLTKTSGNKSMSLSVIPVQYKALLLSLLCIVVGNLSGQWLQGMFCLLTLLWTVPPHATVGHVTENRLERNRYTTQIQTGSMWEWVRVLVLKELFIVHQLPHADFISG